VILHYHGTPLTPRSKLLELAGRCFCVRYGEHRDIEPCHEIGQSVMLDNGAYPAFTKGTPTDWPGYYRWCEQRLEHWTTWAVIPDVIDGDEDANDALVAEWPFGTRGAPVFHLHEPLDRLRRLCDEWPLVCLGSSGAFWKIGSRPWVGRMVEVMDAVTDRDGVPVTRLHLLRGLDFAGGPYPLFSADSTNVARNHAGNVTRGRAARSPRRMADEIDARQCPARWQRTSTTQLGLAVA
jgi:hypothetical protein